VKKAIWISTLTFFVLTGVRVFASEFLPAGAGPILLPGTTVAVEADLAGTVIHDKLIPFRIASAAGALLFEGVLQNRVVKGATGDLHFYYRIRDTKAGLNGIIRYVTTASYAATPMLSVDWRPDGLGTISPKSVQRSAAPGAIIRFEFVNGGPQVLVGGRESKFFYLKTVRASQFKELGSTRIQLVTGQAVSLRTVIPAL
jgi:hypothetical protein